MFTTLTFTHACILSGADKCRKHSYHYVYGNLFPHLKTKDINLLEIGIFKGHSLLLWESYFPNAKIWGTDIVRTIYHNIESDTFLERGVGPGHERITMIFGDSTSSEFANENFENDDFFDIIIDDGSHVVNDQMNTLKNFWPKLKVGGYYIIEDIESPEYEERFESFEHCLFLDLSGVQGRWDDIAVIIQKTSNDDITQIEQYCYDSEPEGVVIKILQATPDSMVYTEDDIFDQK